MPCLSCIDKMARNSLKFLDKRTDWIRALEKASRALERRDSRKSELRTITMKKTIVVNGVEVDPDYSQACLGSPPNECGTASCIAYTDCGNVGLCGCGNAYGGCPAPLAYSHYVSDNCARAQSVDCLCSKAVCANTNCSAYPCSGNCYYNCDDGYTWNGSECVPAAVVVWGGSALPQLEMASTILLGD